MGPLDCVGVMIDQTKQDQAIMGVSQNSLEKFKFLIDELGQVAVRTDGTLNLKGLYTKGKVKSIGLNTTTWTKLTTGLEKVNTIAIQNKSGSSVSIGFEEEALGVKASVTVGTNVFTAVNYGVAGNTISLNFNGTTAISVFVLTWNNANPTNQVAFTGDDVVLEAQTITLSGGVDKKPCGDQWVLENDEGIEIDIRNDAVNLYAIACDGSPVIKLMEIS